MKPQTGYDALANGETFDNPKDLADSLLKKWGVRSYSQEDYDAFLGFLTSNTITSFIIHVTDHKRFVNVYRGYGKVDIDHTLSYIARHARGKSRWVLYVWRDDRYIAMAQSKDWGE